MASTRLMADDAGEPDVSVVSSGGASVSAVTGWTQDTGGAAVASGGSVSGGSVASGGMRQAGGSPGSGGAALLGGAAPSGGSAERGGGSGLDAGRRGGAGGRPPIGHCCRSSEIRRAERDGGFPNISVLDVAMDAGLCRCLSFAGCEAWSADLLSDSGLDWTEEVGWSEGC